MNRADWYALARFALTLMGFIGAHLLPAWPGLRARLIFRLGKAGYLLLYSSLSIALLTATVATALALPPVLLWGKAAWQIWLPPLLMPLALWLIIGGLRSGNVQSVALAAPATLPGGPARLMRHPVLSGFALWAGLHLLPNGLLAHALLFGTLLAFALSGMVVLDRRRQRALGAAGWAEANAARQQGPVWRWLDVLSALLIYGGLLALHRPIIGVLPLP